MDEHSFDGRVAVITGAGRGIGRAYARLLADRGASVVVNDLGGSMRGEGTDAGPAASVAADIVAAGGAAIADTSDVATEVGARALVDAAVGHFGRVDVLITNAGIIRWAEFPDVEPHDFDRHLAVHVWGSFHTARAAWPHLAAQGYGRIVMTTSTGMLGLPNNASYATAKAGVIGLARSLATTGAPLGIKVNLVAPAAMTRMAGRSGEDPDAPASSPMAPDLVAPLVGLLAHEMCPVTGEIYTAGGGRYARMFIGVTEGWVQSEPAPTIEDVARHWDVVNDETGYFVPSNLDAWSTEFAKHLYPSGPDAAR